MSLQGCSTNWVLVFFEDNRALEASDILVIYATFTNILAEHWSQTAYTSESNNRLHFLLHTSPCSLRRLPECCRCRTSFFSFFKKGGGGISWSEVAMGVGATKGRSEAIVLSPPCLTPRCICPNPPSRYTTGLHYPSWQHCSSARLLH